jgi:hypothetical protein
MKEADEMEKKTPSHVIEKFMTSRNYEKVTSIQVDSRQDDYCFECDRKDEEPLWKKEHRRINEFLQSHNFEPLSLQNMQELMQKTQNYCTNKKDTVLEHK